MKSLHDAVSQFRVQGKVIDVLPYGNGHINDTYLVTTSPDDAPCYVLQRINHNVFGDVAMLQENIMRITSHIRAKLEATSQSDVHRKVLQLVPTSDNQLYYFDGKAYWRMTLHIADSQTFEHITPELAIKTGVAFANFQLMLADLPGLPLHHTIPNFHSMSFRLEQLAAAVAEDRASRLEEVKGYVDALQQRAYDMCWAERMAEQGLLPKRVTHCDTKLSNILFDMEDNPLCVIDLDTTMPGFVLSDFGDFVRTACNTGSEDDPNPQRVGVDMGIFSAFTQGYLNVAMGFLTPIEVDSLVFGAKMLTYMQSVRFLTDYLNGDTYYKIKHPMHNLIRTIAQLKMLTSIEQNEGAMRQVVQDQCRYSSQFTHN